MPVVISYARFSSTGQAEGSSILRQTEKAEAYAAANGLVINNEDKFTDQGMSAYDGTNLEDGTLGLILTRIGDGDIPAGSTMIVESFDRLSRADPPNR